MTLKSIKNPNRYWKSEQCKHLSINMSRLTLARWNTNQAAGISWRRGPLAFSHNTDQYETCGCWALPSLWVSCQSPSRNLPESPLLYRCGDGWPGTRSRWKRAHQDCPFWQDQTLGAPVEQPASHSNKEQIHRPQDKTTVTEPKEQWQPS